MKRFVFPHEYSLRGRKSVNLTRWPQRAWSRSCLICASEWTDAIIFRRVTGLLSVGWQRAKDGRLWTLRLYDSLGRETTVRLVFGTPSCEVWATDLKEDGKTPIRDLTVSFRPFEIKTIRFEG